ncbi:hypothetical protein OIU79_007172, partial [Salix purpurea]
MEIGSLLLISCFDSGSNLPLHIDAILLSSSRTLQYKFPCSDF